MGRHYKTFFVVNLRAGHGRSAKAWEQVYKTIHKDWGQCDYEMTNANGHGIVLTTEALRQGYEMVVAVGGDGTVNEVLNGFFEDGEAINPQAVLGIIPGGTGGDFVRSLEYPPKLKERSLC